MSLPIALSLLRPKIIDTLNSVLGFMISLSSSTMQPETQHEPIEESTAVFPAFSQLPTEIRLKIWSTFLCLTLPSPISITISTGAQTQRWVADDSILRKGHQIPAILQVCQESREVGLAKYILGFELEGGLSELPFNHCWKMVEEPET